MNDLKSSTKVLLSHDPNYALEIYIIYLSFRIKLTVRSNCKKIWKCASHFVMLKMY